MSLIVVKDVWKSYGGGDVLCGVSLAVSPGECVALLGRNGCGKSTLLHIIARQILPDRGYVQLAGRARLGLLTQQLSDLGAVDVLTETAKGLGDLLELEQRLHELMASLAHRGDDAQLLRQYGAVEASFRARDGYRWQQRVKAVLMGLGLAQDALHQPANLLSGGERMRLELARLLLQEPDVLLLDEPTNHLDLTATQWLEGFLASYSGACLVVSHDRTFLDAVAQRVIELEDGQATEYRGNFSAYSQQKAQRLQERRQQAQTTEWQVRRDEALIAQLRSIGQHKAAESRTKALERRRQAGSSPRREEKGPAIAFAQPEWTSRLIAEGSQVVKAYGRRRVLNGASFEIAGGERVGIIGPNGAGKTTLLRLLVGEEQPTSGTIRLGSWVRFVYLGQVKEFADPEHSVLEEVLACAPQLSEGAARNLLARFLFTAERVFQRIDSLSGGEKSRLAVLCAMQQEPHCLILDEPTNHLDVPSRECLEEALAEFRGTVIAVSHDRFFLNRITTRILALQDGKLTSFPGNYNAYRKAVALGSGSPSKRQGGAVRSVVVTGKQMRSRKKSQQAKVREYSRARSLDLDKQISATQKRIQELEAQFQEPDFFRHRSSHQALEEHQNLVEELAALLAATQAEAERP